MVIKTGNILVYQFFKNSIKDKNINPDFVNLNDNLKHLKQINNDLQSGEKNFYECNDRIENYLNQSIKLLVSI